MDPHPTLISTKSRFLLTQTRLLSQPLSPSSDWSAFAPPSPPLPPAQIASAVGSLNERLKQHGKNVYSAPSQRHVAEQINTLYWNEVCEEGDVSEGALAVERDADFRDGSVVEGLPEELAGLNMREGQVLRQEDADRYAALRKRLEEAVGRRDEQVRRLQGYRRLGEMIVPLEGARENVQPNLVTKDGELGRELERMRVLCARVAAQVEGGLSEGSGLGEGVGERERLRGVMDLT
jgi:hypothetical protein